MNLNLKHAHHPNLSLELHNGDIQRVEELLPGATVLCEKGLVWLTEPNDLQDYMLRAGHKVVIRKRSNILMEALADASVIIVYPN